MSWLLGTFLQHWLQRNKKPVEHGIAGMLQDVKDYTDSNEKEPREQIYIKMKIQYNQSLLKVSVSVTDIITGSDPGSSGMSWLL